MVLVNKKNDSKLIESLVSQGMSEAMVLMLPLDTAQSLLKVDLSVKKSNVRESIVNDLCTFLDKNTKKTFAFSELENVIRFLNLDNYFDLGDFKPETIADVKALSIADLIKSTNSDSNTIRFTKWQMRAKNYIKSHVIGVTISGNLNSNENLKYKCVKNQDGLFVFSLKVEKDKETV
jgi:hypothetical protein